MCVRARRARRHRSTAQHADLGGAEAKGSLSSGGGALIQELIRAGMRDEPDGRWLMCCTMWNDRAGVR